MGIEEREDQGSLREMEKGQHNQVTIINLNCDIWNASRSCMGIEISHYTENALLITVELLSMPIPGYNLEIEMPMSKSMEKN